MFFQRYKYTSYTEQRAWRAKIFKILAVILAVFIGHLLLSSYVMTVYRVSADTMQPTYTAGDVVLTSPLPALHKDFKRGALVVVEAFEKPQQGIFSGLVQKLTAFVTFQIVHPHNNEDSHIKPSIRRIVGLPGDTIYMDSFILYIKTKDSRYFLTEFEVAKQDYNVKIEKLPENWNSSLPFSGFYPKTTLKENEYFVLCDNRIASGDSRLWGPLHGQTQIKSKILMRYWPFNRFSFF